MRDKSLLIIAACSIIIKFERRLARLKGPPNDFKRRIFAQNKDGNFSLFA